MIENLGNRLPDIADWLVIAVDEDNVARLNYLLSLDICKEILENTNE